jgi:hypothetical protein
MYTSMYQRSPFLDTLVSFLVFFSIVRSDPIILLIFQIITIRIGSCAVVLSRKYVFGLLALLALIALIYVLRITADGSRK